METFTIILNNQMIMALYLVIGAICKKTGVVREEAIDSFTDFLLNIVLPGAILSAFSMDITPDIAFDALMIFVSALVTCILTFLLGKFLYRHYEFERQSVLQYGTFLSNCTFIGLPLLGSIYGAQGIFYASIYVIPLRIAMWSFGINIFARSTANIWDRVRRVVTNPCLIACFIGGLRMLIGLPYPGYLGVIIDAVGNCMTPFCMILVGLFMADLDFRAIFSRDTLYLSFVRLVAIPLALLLGFRIIGIFAIVSEPIVVASVLLTAMPLATTVTMMAHKYNADTAFATQATIATTLFSILTVPILTLLL